MRRFWTPRSAAARLRSSRLSGDLRSKCTNFLVNCPSDESKREVGDVPGLVRLKLVDPTEYCSGEAALPGE